MASEADTKAQANAPRSDSRAAHFRVFLRRQSCFSKNESHDTVAEQFIEILAATGVKRIYGIVGDSLNGLTGTIRRQAKIERVHVRRASYCRYPQMPTLYNSVNRS